MDLWIHGSAAGAAARATAGAAEAAAPAAAPAAALAAAPAADPWIHGSISFIMNQICYYEMKNDCQVQQLFLRKP